MSSALGMLLAAATLGGSLAGRVGRQGFMMKTGAEDAQKYVARELKFGLATDAVGGIEGLIGMNAGAVYDLIKKAGGDHLLAMTREIEQNGDAEDLANWQYIVAGHAQEDKHFPEHVKKQIKEGKYHGGSLEAGDFDTGHHGMTLQDFVKDKRSAVANLTDWHVAAARLYTSTSFWRINKPLRERVRPHPWPLTTYFLCEAIKKMRAVRAATEGFQNEVLLWRGMKGVHLSMEKFKAEGGTELAPMSTTQSEHIAEKYAAGKDSIIFQYKTRAMTTGVSLQYLSVYPKESEYLYPPGTFLAFHGLTEKNGVQVVIVEPQMP